MKIFLIPFFKTFISERNKNKNNKIIYYNQTNFQIKKKKKNLTICQRDP